MMSTVLTEDLQFNKYADRQVKTYNCGDDKNDVFDFPVYLKMIVMSKDHTK